MNVRPSPPSNGPARGNLTASLSPYGLCWWPLITGEDFAALMVEQFTDDTWLRRSPLIGY